VHTGSPSGIAFAAHCGGAGGGGQESSMTVM